MVEPLCLCECPAGKRHRICRMSKQESQGEGQREPLNRNWHVEHSLSNFNILKPYLDHFWSTMSFTISTTPLRKSRGSRLSGCKETFEGKPMGAAFADTGTAPNTSFLPDKHKYHKWNISVDIQWRTMVHLRISFRVAPSLRCSWARRQTTARSDSRCSMARDKTHPFNPFLPVLDKGTGLENALQAQARKAVAPWFLSSFCYCFVFSVTR